MGFKELIIALGGMALAGLAMFLLLPTLLSLIN